MLFACWVILFLFLAPNQRKKITGRTNTVVLKFSDQEVNYVCLEQNL